MIFNSVRAFVFLLLISPLFALAVEPTPTATVQPPEEATEDPIASEAEVEDLLVKLYKEKIFTEDQLRKLYPRFAKFTTNKIWLMNYAVDYKQWDAEKIVEMFPRFEEASPMEVRIRMRVANEDIDYIKKLAKASDKSRAIQLSAANRAREKMISDRDYYRDRKIDHRPSFRVSP